MLTTLAKWKAIIHCLRSFTFDTCQLLVQGCTHETYNYDDDGAETSASAFTHLTL